MAISLTYFDFDGSRGLECRLALTVAGVPFEDVRLSREQWQALKPKTPFGALPILADGDRQLAQSNAILSYIGRGHGLLPADPWEAAQHEAILLSVEDLRVKLPDGKGQTEDDKKAAREAFAAGWLSQWAATVSDKIAGPFLAGSQLSVADIKLFVILRSYLAGTYDYVPASVFDRFPKLLALHAAVAAHPVVAGYFAGRK
ncbi:MAG: glutathione S-transferase family protein [Deltaproteobacteria bacterium]|nr:glutathione S-transferase family protein [Deltaproteobacteria bacterium]